MRAQKIPLTWALRVTDGAVRNGLAVDDLLAQSYIDPSCGDGRDEISYAQYMLLCMNAAVCQNDALQGLGSKRMETGFSSLTVRIVDGSQTLEDAIRALEKFFSLVGPSLRVGLGIEQHEAVMTICADSPDLSSAYTLEANHTGWLALCLSHFLGRTIPLTGVTTRDPDHVSLHQRHWSLGSPVSFGAVTALRFPRALLGARRVGAAGQEAYWDCIRPRLEGLEEDPMAPRGVERGQGCTPLRLRDLARCRGISPSTMGRRLNREHGGYRRARERAIVEAAVRLLRTSNASIDSVGVDLGYADARSFRRFMKNATGMTPQELRASDLPLPVSAHTGPICRRIRQLAASLDA